MFGVLRCEKFQVIFTLTLIVYSWVQRIDDAFYCIYIFAWNLLQANFYLCVWRSVQRRALYLFRESGLTAVRSNSASHIHIFQTFIPGGCQIQSSFLNFNNCVSDIPEVTQTEPRQSFEALLWCRTTQHVNKSIMPFIRYFKDIENM